MDETQARGPDVTGPDMSGTDRTGAASGVAQTAKEQAKTVADEARTQARSVMSDARERITTEARTQSDRLADGIRQMADELNRMAGDQADSPARKIVSRLADGGYQVADHLTKNGPDGVLADVQEFARRRPAAFLATALVAGFVVGQVGKGVLAAGQSPATGRAPIDRTTGYPYADDATVRVSRPMADPTVPQRTPSTQETVVLPTEGRL